MKKKRLSKTEQKQLEKQAKEEKEKETAFPFGGGIVIKKKGQV